MDTKEAGSNVVTPAITKDRFGNKLVFFFKDPATLEELKTFCSHTKGKAIILTGLSKNFIHTNLDDGQIPDAKFVGKTPGKANVVVCRNGSNCPDIIPDKGVLAGGFCTLVSLQADGKTYVVMHKDPTSSIIKFPGGTTTAEEWKKYPESPLATIMVGTAVREIEEESEGEVYIEGKLRSVEGFRLKAEDNIFPLATLNMESSYFGINKIPDTYFIVGAHVTLEEGSIIKMKSSKPLSFLECLFHPSNHDEASGSYTLKYKGHEETQFFHALPFPEDPLALEKTLSWFGAHCYSDKLPRFARSAVLVASHWKNGLDGTDTIGKIMKSPRFKKVRLHQGDVAPNPKTRLELGGNPPYPPRDQ